MNRPRLAALTISALLSTSLAGPAGTIKNVVLVHGAYADGSGWAGVYRMLSADGYHVTVVQNPLTSLDDDVAAVNRALARQDGPVILVGHSYGGAVITQAGTDPKVAGLVYVSAFQPDVGESALKWATAEPPALENGILPPDAAGFSYYDAAKFHAGFAADLSDEQAAFLSASQIPVSVKALGAPVTQAAWNTKPSWAVLSTDDKSINPSIQRTMYARAKSVVTEVKGSHATYISHPQDVANVIEAAAIGVAGGS
ncbi:alpha/beta hydrolase [Deinococcus radiopugnans]|uniref:Alpha/beta hydrolase n=1 Tax=Deinococcus radiopugnans ATCC 19172 TaxID=585398 RepID=A0A5C4XUX3_9DEIO|nr:alpha/beta hydrolase [Deinococcus radiopugnans]MBB6018587.1 pimeloyl-ACP methyl ester carboxylesterase [Deinococcus radiopugnans ATCC 19172]TNM67289.1 alpha/beta hydrolase [Deinococcus radiopugnans ATCC 19172]